MMEDAFEKTNDLTKSEMVSLKFEEINSLYQLLMDSEIWTGLVQCKKLVTIPNIKQNQLPDEKLYN